MASLLLKFVAKRVFAKPRSFNWKIKYAAMPPDEMRRLKQLEDEDSRLKSISFGPAFA